MVVLRRLLWGVSGIFFYLNLNAQEIMDLETDLVTSFNKASYALSAEGIPSTTSIRVKLEKSNESHLKSSSKDGFCSVKEAAYKLLRISASGTFGLSDYGLFDGYLDRIKSECGPKRFIPQQLMAPDSKTPRMVCYRLTGFCSKANPGTWSDYEKENCALETEIEKLSKIYFKLSAKRDEITKQHVDELKQLVLTFAEEIIEKKITKKLTKNPFEQVRLTWEDMYDLRAQIAMILAQRYPDYHITAFIDVLGKVIFSNFDYFAPLGALSGPVGYIVIAGLPIMQETFQCNISIKNILLHGGSIATGKVIVKVPLVKILKLNPNNPAVVYGDKFTKSLITTEVTKWVKHYFGDGLEVSDVSIVKEYGKEFVLISITSALDTALHYQKR